MAENDFYRPTDADALRMENELLAFEVGFLKAQLAESGRVAERASRIEQRSEDLEDMVEQLRGTVKQFEGRLAEAERAEQDLILLLRRLGGSPLGPVLRRAESFRTLQRRYLRDDD